VALSITATSGSCPAAESLSILGTEQTLSWQPVCDFATGIRPVVIAVGALSAGLWLLAMVRRN